MTKHHELTANVEGPMSEVKEWFVSWVNAEGIDEQFLNAYCSEMRYLGVRGELCILDGNKLCFREIPWATDVTCTAVLPPVDQYKLGYEIGHAYGVQEGRELGHAEAWQEGYNAAMDSLRGGRIVCRNTLACG